MPFPPGFLKFRKNRRHLGVSAHRVVVRRHLSWYWYALLAGLAILLVIALFLFVFQREVEGDAQRELDLLRRQVRRLDDELLSLRSTAGTERNAVQMERTTSQQLIGRVKVLESENAALKEDLLLFERLLQASGGEPSIRIEGLKVVPDGSQYRYRVLLAFQPGKRQSEFRGQLQLAVAFSLEGRSKELIIPNRKDGSLGLLVEVRSLLRKEGRFEIPPGAILQSVEARLFQGDTLKTRFQVQL